MSEILERIKEAKEKSKKRRFKQTWDFSINLKGIDLKKPENRFSVDFALPEGRGKDTKVVIFADSLASEARKIADLVITKEQIESFAKNKKKVKEIANKYDWFFGEAPLMPLIAKAFGTILGPRGKIPKPIPPKANLESLVQAARKMVRVSLKGSPVIHVPVGTEDMPEEKIAANIQAVYNFAKEKLPKGRTNIKSTQIKLTMGKPVKLKLE